MTLDNILRKYGEHAVICPAWLGGISCNPHDCGVEEALASRDDDKLWKAIRSRCRHSLSCAKRSNRGLSQCSCGLDVAIEAASSPPAPEFGHLRLLLPPRCSNCGKSECYGCPTECRATKLPAVRVVGLSTQQARFWYGVRVGAVCAVFHAILHAMGVW